MQKTTYELQQQKPQLKPFFKKILKPFAYGVLTAAELLEKIDSFFFMPGDGVKPRLVYYGVLTYFLAVGILIYKLSF